VEEVVEEEVEEEVEEVVEVDDKFYTFIVK
jgi:hypothetical protein